MGTTKRHTRTQALTAAWVELAFLRSSRVVSLAAIGVSWAEIAINQTNDRAFIVTAGEQISLGLDGDRLWIRGSGSAQVIEYDEGDTARLALLGLESTATKIRQRMVRAELAQLDGSGNWLPSTTNPGVLVPAWASQARIWCPPLNAGILTLCVDDNPAFTSPVLITWDLAGNVYPTAATFTGSVPIAIVVPGGWYLRAYSGAGQTALLPVDFIG